MRPIIIVYFLFFPSVAWLFQGCGNMEKRVPSRAVRGELDLKEWDFSNNGVVRLDGEWEFYWDTLLFPDKVMQYSQKHGITFEHVPHYWYRQKQLFPRGSATYRLKIRLPDSVAKLSIDVWQFTSAYRIWCNNELSVVSGAISHNPGECHYSWYRPRMNSIGSPADSLDIVIQIADFVDDLGGFFPGIFIGNEESILKRRLQHTSRELLATGAIFLMGFLHLLLTLLRPKDKSHLVIAAFSFSTAFYLSMSGMGVFRLFFPDLPAYYHILLCDGFLLSLSMCCLVLLSAIWFPYEFGKRIVTGTMFFICTMLIVKVITTMTFHRPYLSGIYLKLETIANWSIFGFFLYKLLVTIRHKRPFALLVTIGAAIFYLSIYGHYFIDWSLFWTFPFGVILFIAVLTYVVAKRYAQSEDQVISQRNQLAHAEKLATIGTLTASVAHEINNPNNALSLSLKSQKQAWDELEPILDRYAEEQGDFEVGGFTYEEFKREIRQSLQRARGNSERIKKIVEDLRAFSRRDEGSYDENVDINEVVHSSLNLVGNLIRKKTGNLHLELQENLLGIKGNHQRLEQVVINLLQNAAQALESPDKSIKISTSHDVKAKRIILAVEDEGKGISKKDLDHIFDPFYTTKGKNEGTGLGLSICKRIVERHGGEISIDSTFGKGTQVFIRCGMI